MSINGIFVQYTSSVEPTTTVFMFCYDWWPCMVINISVQYNGGFIPDIILLTRKVTTIIGEPG